VNKTDVCSTVAVVGILGLAYWFATPQAPRLSARVPIPDNNPTTAAVRASENTNQGTLIRGTGKASREPGNWPQFRGANRDGVAEGVIASSWPPEGPKLVWRVQLGDGHAGAAVRNGRVYVTDYDEEKKEDAIRCLSFDTGEEIWRYTYYVKVKRYHGMSRTVPAVTENRVVSLGPLCHVRCLDAESGELVWKKDLVADYQANVPEWYAGQCPLVDGGRVILAPGGSCMMTALDPLTGKTIWETPNPESWQMTHSSILPISFEGKRQYVWCSTRGAVGVDAETGSVLWKLPEWQVRIATVPSPVDAGEGRIFFAGGYNSGSMMIQLARQGDRIVPKEVFRTKPDVFGSDQQTPIFYNGFIYGVVPGGRLACLSLEGKRLWLSSEVNFGLGPYLMIGGKMLLLRDNPCELYLFEVGPNGARKLASRRVLDGHDAWAPMAFVNGRVLLRDATTMLCLDLR